MSDIERRYLAGVKIPEQGLDEETLGFVRAVVDHQVGLARLELIAAQSSSVSLIELAQASGDELNRLSEQVTSRGLVPESCPSGNPVICRTDTAIRMAIVEVLQNYPNGIVS